MSSPCVRLAALLFAGALAGLTACDDGTAPTPGAGAGPTGAGPGTTDAPPGVILFTVDTLRADRVAPYAENGPATPAVARLAAESRVFVRAYSQATNTNPSVTSFLTGLVPPRHGVFTQVSAPRPEVVSLAAMLRAHDVATGSFVANLCKLQDVPGSVFEEGWGERFCGMDDARPQHAWGAACVDAATAWIAARHAAGEPYFAWIHLMDPHSEYDPPPAHWDHAADPVREKIDQLRHYSAFEETGGPPAAELARLNALYDAEVAGADEQLARLLAFLEELPGGARVPLLFSADHGEELFETWPRIGHGFSMTEGVLRVPLMVRAPGLAPGRFEDPVETLSITSTVLDLFDVEPPYPLDGRSLLLPDPGRAFARSYEMPIVLSLRGRDTRVWLRGTPEAPARDETPWRLSAPWFEQPEVAAVYDASAASRPIWLDAARAEPASEAARLRTEARRQLTEILQGTQTLVEIDDPAYLEQLRQLGYLGDG